MDHSKEASHTLKGGCLCGAVRYQVTAQPVMAGFCYCESCRKLSGSGRTFHAAVPEDALHVVGETHGFDWQADSGNTVTSRFCPGCGSPLFARSAGMPGLVTFRVASLDEPGAIAPQMSVYTKRRIDWEYLDPALTAFAEMPPMSSAG